MARIVGKPNADDVKRVAVAALVAALDDGKDQARKKPGLTGMRAVATGAVLYTAGKVAFSGRRFINERLAGARARTEDRGGRRGLRGGRGARGRSPSRRGGRGLRGAGGRGARGGARRRGGRGLRGGRGARGGARRRGGRGLRGGGARGRGGRGLRGRGRGRRGAQRRLRAARPSRTRTRTTTSTRPISRRARAASARRWGAAEPWPPNATRRDGALPARGGGRAAAARLVHRLPARAAQGRDLARAREEPLLHPRRSCSTEPEQPDPAQQTGETCARRNPNGSSTRRPSGYLERPRPSGLADVIEIILDKGHRHRRLRPRVADRDRADHDRRADRHRERRHLPALRRGRQPPRHLRRTARRGCRS